jgi:hypothetical protein
MDRQFPRKFSSVLGASWSFLVTPVCGAEDWSVSTPATFSNYELAGNSFVTGFGVGTTCSNSSGTLPDGTTETQTASAIYTLGAGLGL